MMWAEPQESRGERLASQISELASKVGQRFIPYPEKIRQFDKAENGECDHYFAQDGVCIYCHALSADEPTQEREDGAHSTRPDDLHGHRSDDHSNPDVAVAPPPDLERIERDMLERVWRHFASIDRAKWAPAMSVIYCFARDIGRGLEPIPAKSAVNTEPNHRTPDLDDVIERAERLLKRLTELRATDAVLAEGHIERLAEENERYRAALEDIADNSNGRGSAIARAALERQT